MDLTVENLCKISVVLIADISGINDIFTQALSINGITSQCYQDLEEVASVFCDEPPGVVVFNCKVTKKLRSIINKWRRLENGWLSTFILVCDKDETTDVMMKDLPVDFVLDHDCDGFVIVNTVKSAIDKYKNFLKLINQTTSANKMVKDLGFKINETDAEPDENLKSLLTQNMMLLHSGALNEIYDISSGTIHEINQFLSGIRGYAEAIKISKERGWTIEDDEILHSMSEIMTISDQLTGLVSHHRAFADRSSREDVALVEIGKVINSALQLIVSQIRARGASVVVEPVSPSYRVMANYYELEEVLLCVLRNSRDALLEISCTEFTRKVDISVNKNGQQYNIKIKDNGCGMSEEVLDNAFKPFFTTKKSKGNAGIGLSIAKSNLEKVRGGINLSSCSGGGTVVTISLPCLGEEN